MNHEKTIYVYADINRLSCVGALDKRFCVNKDVNTIFVYGV